MSKKTVAVIFGGVSSEHEVSCMSVSSVWENIDREKYEVLLIGITKNGEWRLYGGDVRKARRASNSLDERRFSSPKSEGTQTDGLQTPRVHATTKRI